MINPEFVKYIDWSNPNAYKDLAVLLHALSEAFGDADVTSGTNHFVDGHVKRSAVEQMDKLAAIFKNPEEWLIVREPRTITRGQGKVNN